MSKNNNNLLRLDSIIRAFPNCIILIPFRDPFQQANSLLNQHNHFTKLQNGDSFVKKYMTYLVHHEFGLDHRPYTLNESINKNIDKKSINYWLEQWIHVYKYLSKEKFSKKNNILYIDYEYLCKNFQRVLKCIQSKANLKNTFFENGDLKFSSKELQITNGEFLSEAKMIFSKLKELNNKNFL